jgi:hypothetical protein
VTLHVVPDDSDPLSLSELQKRGNELLRAARKGAVEALHASTQMDLFYGGSFDHRDIRRLQHCAAEAASSWAAVAHSYAELLNEFDRSNNASKGR